MKFYHATTVPALKTLKLNSLNSEGAPVAYVTDNFAYSLFYIRDRDIDFVTCGVDENGVVQYDEKFSGQLETLYRGMQGWVYEVETEAIPTDRIGVFVSHSDANVIASAYIPDALDAIRSEIYNGNISLLSYEDTTPEQRKMNREGVARLLQTNRYMHPKRRAFYREHFPDAWELAYGKMCAGGVIK